MPSKAETIVASVVGKILQPLMNGQTVDFPGTPIGNGLEYFLPEVLRECFAYWKSESLDGVFIRRFIKRGPHAIEITGTCILISDQTVTPFHIRLEISASADNVSWLECRLGEPGPGAGGMMRVPYSDWHRDPLKGAVEEIEAADWVYKATFGVKNCHTNWK